MFITWSYFRIKDEVLRKFNWFKPDISFSTDYTKVDPLLRLCVNGFICGLYFVIIFSSILRLLVHCCRLCFVIVEFSGYLHS